MGVSLDVAMTDTANNNRIHAYVLLCVPQRLMMLNRCYMSGDVAPMASFTRMVFCTAINSVHVYSSCAIMESTIHSRVWARWLAINSLFGTTDSQ